MDDQSASSDNKTVRFVQLNQRVFTVGGLKNDLRWRPMANEPHIRGGYIASSDFHSQQQQQQQQQQTQVEEFDETDHQVSTVQALSSLATTVGEFTLLSCVIILSVSNVSNVK